MIPRQAAMRRVPLACACVLTACGGRVLAQQAPQDDGPVVVGEQRPRFKGLELRRWNAGLDFMGQWRREQLEQEGQATLTETESLYRETLTLDGEGSIGHKNLVDWGGSLRLGLEQDFLESDATGTSRDYSAVTAQYDLRALLLGTGPAPTTIYGRRDQADLHQNFGGTTRSTLNEIGAITQIASSWAPTSIQIFHREQDQEDRLGLGGFGTTQDSAVIRSDLRLSGSQRVQIDYTFDHVDQSGGRFIGDTYDQHDANITHWLNFGPQDLSSLRSMLRFQDRSGAFSEQVVRLEEELRLRHTDRLETRYNLRLENLERAEREQQSARGSAMVRHRLFDSLTSTATVGASWLEVPDLFESSELFVSGSLDYTKRVPYGRLGAGLGLGATRQENGERGTTVTVVNGAFVFNDPFPVTIERRNVVPASIVVRDTARLRVFVNGIDYTVQAFPDRVELRRVIGGAILNGQAVVIDFDIGPEPANEIDTMTASASLRYDISEGALRGLSLYTVYRHLDQSVDAVDPGRFRLDDVRNLKYGAQYRTGSATFIAEREHHESDFAPYDANRLQARYDHRFSRDSLLSLGLSWDQVDYRLNGQSLELYLATARWSQQFGEHLSVSANAEGRLEHHSESADLTGLQVGVEVTYARGQTTIYGSVYTTVLDAGPTDTTSEMLTIGLRRSF